MRVAVLVNGPPGSGKSTVAKSLAGPLGLPILSKDVVKEVLFAELGCASREESKRLGAAAGETVWALLSDMPDGAVVDSWLPPNLRGLVRDRLDSAMVERVVEVWCRCPIDDLVRRFAGRRRHPGHFDAEFLAVLPDVAAGARPLALGPVIEIDTATDVESDELVESVCAALTIATQ